MVVQNNIQGMDADAVATEAMSRTYSSVRRGILESGSMRGTLGRWRRSGY